MAGRGKRGNRTEDRMGKQERPEWRVIRADRVADLESVVFGPGYKADSLAFLRRRADGLERKVRSLVGRMEVVEAATAPEDVPPRQNASSAPSTGEWNTLTVDLAKAETRIKELEAEVSSLKEKMRTNATLLTAWRGEVLDQVAGNLARLSGLADKEGK